MNERKKMKRGANQRENCTFIGVWIPKKMAELIDMAVTAQDLDRSKFLRRALESKISES